MVFHSEPRQRRGVSWELINSRAGTHGESVEQKSTARMAGNARFPPLAEMVTAQPCQGMAEKVSWYTTEEGLGMWNRNARAADAGVCCEHCDDEIIARALSRQSDDSGKRDRHPLLETS